MLKSTVKFCGGCNPRFDRGEAYKAICEALSSQAAFSLPEEDKRYDVLLIIRGCTGCPYLYDEIEAAHRVILDHETTVDSIIAQIKSLAKHQGG